MGALSIPASASKFFECMKRQGHFGVCRKINLNIPSGLPPSTNEPFVDKSSNLSNKTEARNMNGLPKIWVPSNPRGAERLPPTIVASESDFYLHRLFGKPSEDLVMKQKYLVTFTVGYDQRKTVDSAVKKFSENFTVLLFHYDGRTTEWDEFEWSKRAIHILKTCEEAWPGDFTAGSGKQRVYMADDKEKRFVEIMAPVFSRDAWRCVWHMIQNDLVHGWGLDFALQKCVELVYNLTMPLPLMHLDVCFSTKQPAHEKIGVVDAQWILHQGVPSLGKQGQVVNGKAPWHGAIRFTNSGIAALVQH
ncbi:hypothetical protein RJ640_016057 [Escallonia rubra]|uniref:Uncharacterized protein n=1 Tax=Escallonia rubra TaxID=112253 RepID=A0AA88RDI7_9ASTE|nr:hypothetical protein RJ640_016057 [Escallonia rubra]